MSDLRGKRPSLAIVMIIVRRGRAFGPCGWPNASGGERPQPRLRTFLQLRRDKIKGPSSDLLPTLECPSVSRDLLAVSPHARSPLGHPFGVLPAPLGLELVVVFSEPGFSPDRGAASLRNAGLAVPTRPASASIGDRFAAGCAVRAHQPIKGSIDFQIRQRIFSSVFRGLLA